MKKNKDLKADFVAQNEKFFKTIITKPKYSTLSLDEEGYIYNTIEISKEEYENGNNMIMPLVESEPVITEYKRLVTSLSYISSTKKYRAKSTLYWRKLPKTRSYDIIAMGNNGAVSQFVSNSNIAYSIYTRFDTCTEAGSSTKENYTSGWKKRPDGVGVNFKLPNTIQKTYEWDDYKGDKFPCVNPMLKTGLSGKLQADLFVDSLQTTIYYDLSKISDKSLVVYGGYRHAQKGISLNLSSSFGLGSGLAINLDATLKTYYDTIDDTYLEITNPAW